MYVFFNQRLKSWPPQTLEMLRWCHFSGLLAQPCVPFDDHYPCEPKRAHLVPWYAYFCMAPCRFQRNEPIDSDTVNHGMGKVCQWHVLKLCFVQGLTSTESQSARHHTPYVDLEV